jgi:ABC-type Na+ efflux pump permease subunit
MEELTKLAKNKTVLLAGGVVLFILLLSLVSFLFFSPSQKSTKNSANNSAQKTTDVKIGAVDLDQSDASQKFFDSLGSLKGRVFRFANQEALKKAVANHEIDAGVLVSSGFSASLSGHKQTTVTIVTDPSSAQSTQAGQSIAQGVQNYSQQNGNPVVVITVTVTPQDGSSGSSGGSGGSSGGGPGNSSSGGNSPTRPRITP